MPEPCRFGLWENGEKTPEQFLEKKGFSDEESFMEVPVKTGEFWKTDEFRHTIDSNGR